MKGVIPWSIFTTAHCRCLPILHPCSDVQLISFHSDIRTGERRSSVSLSHGILRSVRTFY